VDGLIDLLEEEDYSTKVVAALFLSQIGSTDALEPLVRQSLEYNGTGKEKVFTTAIRVIIDKNPDYVNSLREEINNLLPSFAIVGVKKSIGI